MKNLILFLALTGLLACSDIPKKTKEEVLPVTLAPRQVVQMKALSEEQKEEIRTVMHGLHTVPDTFLYLVSANESRETKESRAEKMDLLQGFDRQVFERMMDTCTLQNPVRTSKDQVSSVIARIGGDACPIQHEEFSSSETKARALQEQVNDSQARNEFLTQIKAVDLQNQTGLRSVSMKSTYNVSTQTELGVMKSHAKSSINMVLETTQAAKILIHTTAESLKRRDYDSSYTEMNFKFEKSTPTVQVFRSETEQRFYLNGQEVSSAEIKALFGYDLATQSLRK